MVLQDLGDAPSDSFSDSQYPSGGDSYSSSSSTSHYDASSLPQPIPVLGPFLGFSEGAIRFKTESTIKFAERKVNRALTREEAQALAGHLYKLEQSKSYFTAAGAAVGTWRWYTTMAKCRYPLYQPKLEDINPNKFMFVKGPMAQYARHSWRLLLYMFVAGEMGKLLGQVTAQPIAAHDTANDPQLAQFAVDLKTAISSDSSRARGGDDTRRREWQERIAQERASRDNAKDESSRGSWGRKRTPVSSDDDMSPTAGNESWSSSTSWSDSAFSSDSSPQNDQSRQQRHSQPSPWETRTTQPNDNDYDDDASPTGGAGLYQDRVQNQNRPGESAWERLRRGGTPTPGQHTPSRRAEAAHREQREGSTLGDGFAFAESDEERKKAQERAQREFDARIERERQGKDFNEEKRW